MKYIEYAKFRGFEISYLLKFEISSFALYLIDPKDGSLKDPAKSNLSNVEIPQSDCIFFILWLMPGKFLLRKSMKTVAHC